MRLGKFKANEATLRLKMDMTSANFNMYDQVRAFPVCVDAKANTLRPNTGR